MTIHFVFRYETDILSRLHRMLTDMVSTFRQLEGRMPLMGSAALPFTDVDFLLSYARSYALARMTKIGEMPITYTFLTRFGGVETLELTGVPQDRDVQLMLASVIQDALASKIIHAYALMMEMWMGEPPVEGEDYVPPRKQESRREGVTLRACLPTASKTTMYETIRDMKTGVVTGLVDIVFPAAKSIAFNPMFADLFDPKALLHGPQPDAEPPTPAPTHQN